MKACLTLGLTAMLMVGCGSSTASTSDFIATGSGAVGPSPALFNRVAFQYSSQLGYKQDADRYQFMVLTSLDAAKVAALHRADPKLKILMYSMALYSDAGDPHAYETCTSYSKNNADDPSWFLLNQNGQRLREVRDDMMDMGNPGYQQDCVNHAISLAKHDGFNGILFDGLDSYWEGFVPSGSEVVKYPSPSPWRAALQSFLNYAGKTVQAHGLMAFANIGNADHSLWEAWTTPLSGSMEQGFTDGGEGLAQQVPFFSEKLANDAWSEAHDKYALEDSYNMTEAGNSFGLAAMLLVADGYSSWSTSNTNNTNHYEHWYPEYAVAQALGAPTGPYTRPSNRIYERHFQNGLVVVNPTSTSVSSFALGGSYRGATTPTTSSVSLPPTSGLILLKAP